MLQANLDFKSLEAKLDALGDQSQKAARLSARLGAKMYYEAVLATVPVSHDLPNNGHWFHGTSFKSTGQKYWFESGSLKAAVYQVYAKDATPKHPEYQIAWNHRKVPYGFMVTYGTKKPTKPNKFISRAKNNVQQQVEAAMKAEFTRVLNER